MPDVIAEFTEQPDRRRHLPWAVGALAFLGGEGVLRASWLAGARWGYTACDRTDDPPDPSGGCGADQVTAVPFWPGWGALALGVLLAGVVVLAIRRRTGRGVTTVTWVASAGLAVASFPLHLLFQLPAAAAGRPSDWRDLTGRLALLGGAAIFGGLAASLAPGRRATPAGAARPRPLPRWARAAAWVATVLPWIGWAVPHAFWVLGISADLLDDAARDLDRATLVAITVVPPLVGLLALGLIRPWGQVFPRWVPGIGGRGVPRLLALVPAGVVALALVTYGLLSAWVMVRSLADGSMSWAQLADGWAVAGTVLVFSGWGAALAVAAFGYHRATRPTVLAGPQLAAAGRCGGV